MTNLSSLYTNINDLVKGYEKQSGSDGSSNTVFTLTNAYVMGNNTLLVFVNGQKAEKVTSASDTTEYEETNSYTITFGSALQGTDVVEFYIIAPYNLSQDNFDSMINSYQSQVGGLGGFKNKIINGDFNIAQRGTSFAAIADGTYNLDRFRYNKNGTMVHTVTQDTDVPTVAQSEHKSNYSLKMDCTTADAAVAASDFCAMQYKIEGYDFAAFVGKTATLSFWIKSTKTGTFCISLNNGGGDDSYVAEYTVSLSDTWEKKEIEIPFDYTGGTWDYTNGIGLNIYWWLTCGTTYHTTTTDAWLSAANKFATANQVNACDNVANNFILSQIQLEIGSSPTSFEDRSIQQELAMCQRYYESSFALNVTPANGIDGPIYNCTAITASAIYGSIPFLTRKRAASTITFYYDPAVGSAGQWGYYDSDWYGANILIGRINTTQFTYVIYPTGLTVNSGRISIGNWTADAEL